MLGDVSDEEVASWSGQPLAADRLGVELPREVTVQRTECLEPGEHLPVAVGVGTSPFDDVAPVGSLVARGVDVRRPSGECGHELGLESACLGGGQSV